MWDEWKAAGEKGVEDPLIGWHYYWRDGFHIESANKKLKTRFYGRVMVDGGYIGADEALQEAFPDLQGGNADFRELRVILTGTAYDHIDFKFDMDFANVRDIKDIWIGYRKVPFFGDIRVGHFKEPFSMEQLGSTTNITFMERALPTEAMSPGRNMGIMCRNSALDDRMTWAAGAFLVTGSFSGVGGFSDQLTDAYGTAITARVTGLPRYADNGRTLFHLGFSYSHQFRNKDRAESDMKLRAHPESRLTDQVLVNTGEFPAEGADLFGGELAMISGPLSFQGEYFHIFTDASTVGNPRFWGFYGYASYFLTGEHRSYDRSRGIFTGITPKEDFHLLEKGWGAWELGFRFSHLDLNDKGINGGKETNFTFGVNWYLNEKTRFMFNYIRAKVKNRETPPPIEDGIADILQVRFQIIF
ncbi:MAG: OprO/OprP family phosphate-selective porin [Desulfobacteraceae bacterium]|nr:OprO/OprP family phosphate-selective porin [Desulfobacteraceae bacterium]